MTTKEKSALKRLLLPIAALIFFLYFGMKYMGTDDFSRVLTWWCTLFMLGLAFQPLTMLVFHRFHDGGWMFSKTLGIAIGGWLMWFLSSCHILKFTRFNCMLVVLLCFLLNVAGYYYFIKRKNRKQKYLNYYTSDKICSMFSAEVIFLCVFICWCYMKGINPEAFGTERFMDYSYMMSLSKTDYMPAKDVWFSGNGINYYYVGQYMCTFVQKLTGVGVEYSYNLAMMLIATLGFCLPYSIGVNIMRTFITDHAKQTENSSVKELENAASFGGVGKEIGDPYWRPLISGVISGLAVAFSGNLQYPIYKFLYPRYQYLTGEQDIYNYWYPDATRFIGYFPENGDKTIHEMPIYSYVVGDLHAHVINTIFVLTVIAVLFAWILKRKATMDARRAAAEWEEPNLKKEIFQPEIILAAFFVGLFHTTNYWDFPIYFVVSGAVILFSNLICYGYKKRAWILTAFQAGLFVVLGTVVSLPFTLNFDSISTSIRLCVNHSTLYQLFILWGLPSTCVIIFFIILLRERAAADRALRFGRNTGNEEPRKQPWIERFMTGLTVTDLFVLTIGFCALGLVLLPEVIYVVDIYSGDYKRANTMFKLTYQAFIMFGIAIGYIIVKYLSMPKKRVQKTFALIALIVFCSTLGYSNEAFTAWFSGYYEGLDGSAFIAKDCNKADDEMIDYINENIEDQCVILEMCGLSYTYFNRISVFTGNETVLGWQTHEWLWRCSGNLDYPQEVSNRHTDIITIYTSKDEAIVRELIDQYGIDYIYVGECERVDGYSQITEGENMLRVEGNGYTKIDTNLDLLLSLGEVVKMIPSEPVDGSPFDTYLIKVNPKAPEPLSRGNYAGTVSVKSSANCDIEVSKQSGVFGSRVEVLCTPREGYDVEEILVNGEIIDGNQFTIANTSNEVSVNLGREKHNVTVEESLHGMVTLESESVSYLSNIMLTCEPEDGYEVAGIVLNGEQAEDTVQINTEFADNYSEWIVQMPNEDTTVQVLFAPITQ